MMSGMPLCVSFGEQMLSFLSGKYIAVQWLSQCVDLCLASGDTAKQFYKVVVAISFPIQRSIRVLILHIPMNARFSQP